MAKLIDFRIGIRRPDGYESNVWKVWAEKAGDVYLSMRTMTRIEKYSFHVSGICRQAFTTEYGRPITLPDRAMFKWHRAPTPPSGSGGVAMVAQVAYPSDYLSRPITHDGKITWLDAAPAGGATLVEIAYTHDTEEVIQGVIGPRSDRQLLRYVRLPAGDALIAMWSHIPWENRDLTMPGDASATDLLFSAVDPKGTGRPVRIVLGPKPGDGDTLRLQELGGFPVSEPA